MTADELAADFVDLELNCPVLNHLELPNNPTIVVVGAYKGRLTHWLITHWPNAKIVAFEPQQWAFDEATKRVGHFVILHNTGLHTRLNTEQRPMGEFHTDACSLLMSTHDTGIGWFEHYGHLVDYCKAPGSWQCHIDLMIMNIEGYEWALLNDMATTLPGDAPFTANIDQLLVQFHESAGVVDGRVSDLLTSQFGPPVFDDYPSWIYWKKQ
jgi:hypothetical protein